MPTHPLKSIVVDDEKPSRQALINYTRQFCADVNVVAECENIKAAYSAIIAHSPKLVFLDIEMPRGSGIELLKMFNPIPFMVIFITAFSDYAVQAFRYSATDFLLKPIKVAELVEAVSKAQNELALKSRLDKLDVLVENFNNQNLHSQKLVISNIHGFTVINTSDIIMCQADRYCTNFIMKNGERMKSSHNLRYYEDLLPATQFMRVHNSFMVNLGHVCGYNNHGFIKLINGLKCSLSNARKTDFLRFFKNEGR